MWDLFFTYVSFHLYFCSQFDFFFFFMVFIQELFGSAAKHASPFISDELLHRIKSPLCS